MLVVWVFGICGWVFGVAGLVWCVVGCCVLGVVSLMCGALFVLG